MSDPDISEMQIPPHFTNIQHGLQLARKFLAAQDTPNRQVMLITDGLPTAHFEGERLYLLYPPDPPHRRRDAARGAALRQGRDHDQHLPAGKLEPDAGRRALRLQGGRIDQGPRLLHRRPRAGSLRGVGLHCAAEADYWIVILGMTRGIRSTSSCGLIAVSLNPKPRDEVLRIPRI